MSKRTIIAGFAIQLGHTPPTKAIGLPLGKKLTLTMPWMGKNDLAKIRYMPVEASPNPRRHVGKRARNDDLKVIIGRIHEARKKLGEPVALANALHTAGHTRGGAVDAFIASASPGILRSNGKRPKTIQQARLWAQDDRVPEMKSIDFELEGGSDVDMFDLDDLSGDADSDSDADLPLSTLREEHTPLAQLKCAGQLAQLTCAGQSPRADEDTLGND